MTDPDLLMELLVEAIARALLHDRALRAELRRAVLDALAADVTTPAPVAPERTRDIG